MKIFTSTQIEARCKKLEMQDTTESREICQMLRYQQDLLVHHRAEATHNRLVAEKFNKQILQLKEAMAMIREIAK